MESKWLDGFHNHLAWLLHLEIQYKSLYRRILLPLHRSPTPPPPSFRPRLLPRSPGNYEVHPRNSHVKSTILAMPLISVLIIYMGPVSIHVKSYILGLYACKSFYPCLFKNSYAIKCFLYVGLNFHLGKRLPWRKIIICKALKKKTKHECFLCKKKVDRGSYHCGIILSLKP